MVATKSKLKSVGRLDPKAHKNLETVCSVRGWTKVEAVRRMTDRELEAIEREQQKQHAAAGT